MKYDNKKILFIASGYANYSRVALFSSIISTNMDSRIIVSNSNYYIIRFLSVYILFLKEMAVNKLNYDRVVLGFMAQPLAPLVRLFWKRELVSDAYFSLYDTICFDKKYFTKNSLIGKFSNWLDRFTVNHSDKIICDTDKHIEYFKKLLSKNTNTKFYRVLIGAQEEIFIPGERLGLNNELIVTFHGLFIPLQGVEYIIRAAEILQNKNIPVTFNMIGSGQTYSECVELAKELNLKNVNFLGKLPVTDIPVHISKSHIGLGIFGISDKAKRVIPNKAFEILASKKLLITGDTEGIKELLVDNVNAILCKAGEPKALADKIEWVYNNYDESQKIAINGYETYCNYASKKALTKQLLTALLDKI